MTIIPFKTYVSESLSIIKNDYIFFIPLICLTLLTTSFLQLETQWNVWVSYGLDLFCTSLTAALIGSYFLTGKMNIGYAFQWVYSKFLPLLANCGVIYFLITFIVDKIGLTEMQSSGVLEQSLSGTWLLYILIGLPCLLIIHFLPISILYKRESIASYIPNLIKFLWINKRHVFYFCSWLLLLRMVSLWAIIAIYSLPAPVSSFLTAIVLGSVEAWLLLITILFYRKQSESLPSQ